MNSIRQLPTNIGRSEEDIPDLLSSKHLILDYFSMNMHVLRASESVMVQKLQSVEYIQIAKSLKFERGSQ